MDVAALFVEAVRKHQSGDSAGAEQLYRAVVQADPTNAPAWCNLGVLLVQAGRLDEVETCYRRALDADPSHIDAHYNLGNLYRRLGRYRDAQAEYETCLRANPSHARASFNLGLTLVRVGDYDASVRCFQTVLTTDPAMVDAYSQMGDAHLRAGRADEAIEAFQEYISRKPDDPRGPNNLALARTNKGDYAGAAAVLEELLNRHPAYAEGHNTLGVAYEGLGRKDDALSQYVEAVRLKPEFADAWSNRGINLLEQGQADDAIDCLRRSLSLRPVAPAIHSNLLLALNYSSKCSPAEVAAEHRTWGERYGQPLPAAPPVADPTPNRRLKIGYVSADFRTHTVASFIEVLLRHHDRERFHVTAYASVQRPDETTARLQPLADDWRPIAFRSDWQVSEQVRQDQIDVLVDLGGHTAGNRLDVFARRQAPLQFTLFGYPNTTGLAAVDFRLSDSISDPPGQTEVLYTEKITRLPDLAWAYQPPADAPIPGPLPYLERGSFTFGCLNNPAKLSDACLTAWSQLLAGLPGSKLVVLAGQSAEGAKKLADRFEKVGVPGDRVEFVLRLPRDEYFEVFQLLDFTLDPFPYNGGVTTCDSLWMGVPVLAVEGASYISRQGLAVLTSLEMTEFVSKTPEGLLEIARAWSTRKSELAGIREGLRAKVSASAVADVERYVRNLESVVLSTWANRAGAEQS